ncbi:MAG TPA: tRNA glutamyl-Q(34) synthetase GluQRS, partial [Casimicrobiaceae bacterium]
QDLLGLPTPAYLHVPVALNAAGEKLGKQTRAAPLSDTPLPALLAAWRFLDQPMPPGPPTCVAEFWTWAIASWQVARLPPVPTLPAPSATDSAAATGIAS